MLETIKKRLSLENLMCFYICICPVLDISSFLFRNYFKTSFSISTILRPIIPCIVFIILFVKEKNKKTKLEVSKISTHDRKSKISIINLYNKIILSESSSIQLKKQKIIIVLIYVIYSIIHLSLFKKLHNESSYGTIINEAQYIVNYSFMIINLYLFYTVIKDKNKIYKSVFISSIIYTTSIFIAIITNTSSSTYIEKIGYKGYFESGNSLCTVLVLSLCILLSSLDLKADWKKVILIFVTGIYLVLFSAMRTGLYGFSLIIAIFILGKFFVNIRDKINYTKKQIIIITVIIIIFIILIFILGSKNLARRQLLKQNELNNIDAETLEQRYVTGDILNLYKQIRNGIVPENYMSEQEKNAIIDLCEFAKKIKLSNVDLRAQQFIYNVFLLKEQKNLGLILFGNGYKNQTGELVMEMEIPALLFNFGFIGFILYFVPFLAIFLYGLYKWYKNIKIIRCDYIMTLTGCGLAICLSTLSGYVYFNFSSMTMAIILNILLLKNYNKI